MNMPFLDAREEPLVDELMRQLDGRDGK